MAYIDLIWVEEMVAGEWSELQIWGLSALRDDGSSG